MFADTIQEIVQEVIADQHRNIRQEIETELYNHLGNLLDAPASVLSSNLKSAHEK